MKRGEVWRVNFEPSIGGEGRKERPAVIVSNDVQLSGLPLKSRPHNIVANGGTQDDS
jgi:PemK-like, MazF-like toxin of type II toxin-antitoxin system